MVSNFYQEKRNEQKIKGIHQYNIKSKYNKQTYNQVMILYIFEAIILFLFTIAIVWYFSHQSTPYYVRALTVLSFNLSFICFLILPMDIYETSVTGEESNGISLAWFIVYDLNFFLCWFVLPFVQEYEDSGQFTRMGKVKQSLKTNAILILAIIVAAIILVIYLVIVGKFKISDLPQVFATIVNVFGLCLVSIMLGFGLVTFPKQNYLKINYKRRVNKCHRMAEMLKSEQQQIKQQIYDISKILEIRQRSPESDGHQTQILFMIQQKIDFSNFRTYAEPNENLKKLKNSALNTIINKRIIQFNAFQSQLDELVDELRQVSVSFSTNSYTRSRALFIFLFSITTFVSILIFLAEISTFISVFSYVNILSIINSASPATSYVMNCFGTFYIVYVVTHTVFRIKIYKVFSLYKKHSSSSSLMFTAINLARICYPLCYNYLQIAQIKQAAFLTFFGEINFDSKYVFIFPIIMIVFGLFNLLDIYDTIMGYLGLGSYAFDEDDERQKAEEGQKILAERLRERNIQNNKMEMIQLL